MKKSYNPVADVRNESVEGTRRLYRAISDIARNLDECRDRSQSCTEVFLPSTEAQRSKLREYCERLIFSDPLGFGRKGEELLWRKGYYDVVTVAKRLRKNNVWTKDEEVHLQHHLYAGIGHYHHIIFRLQIEFKLDLRGFVDFPLLVNDGGLIKGKPGSSRCQEEGGAEWAHQAVHRCLVYLGDLSRYFLEVYPQWDSGLPQRYYLQAVSLNADFGMPHNQLGTLSGVLHYSVDAAYHYMRCLSCLHPFEGADGNLRRIFEKNAKWLEHHNRWNLDDKMEEMSPTERIHRFVARFLVVVDVWFYDKNFPANPNQLCQQMVDDLKQCLQYMKQFPSDSQLVPEQMDFDDLLNLDKTIDDKPEYLKDEVVFKLVSMLLLCISRLQAKRSKLLSGLIVFTLAIISEIVQQVINHMQDSVLTLSIPSIGTPFTPPSLLTPENSDPCSTSNESSACASLLSCPSASLPDVCVNTLSVDVEKPSTPQENGSLPKMNGISETVEVKKKDKRKLKFLSKFRRRRPKAAIHNSSEDSDYSDGEVPYCSSNSSDEGNEDISENDEQLIYDEVDDSDDSSTSTQVESKDLSSCDKLNDDIDVLVNGSAQSEDNSFGEVNGQIFENGINGDLVEEEISTNEEVTCSSSDSHEDRGKITDLQASKINNDFCKNTKSNNQMDPADVIELVAEEGLLQVMKVCGDWLLGEKEVLRACGRVSPTLLNRIVTMLNLINVDGELLEKRPDSAKFFKLKNISQVFKKVPLTEDVRMKGVCILKEAHEMIDWEFFRNCCLNSKEEALLRVYKLVEFGKFLASIEELKIVYDEQNRNFSVNTEADEEGTAVNGMEGHSEAGSGACTPTPARTAPQPAAPLPAASLPATAPLPAPPPGQGAPGGGPGVRRDDLMQHMGQLWLRAQVRELESRVQQQRRRGGATLSPYLAVDCDALTSHMALVKQLVAARRFIVLIPGVVVCALDELKREVGRAREAIRWLEAQFQRGNRFLRAQRHHERLPLPLIKYPKKKEREAWFFFQVVECCYYFSQQNGVHELTPETCLVTLLTGQQGPLDDSSRAYSPLGVARSAGVNLEHIEAFHAKWKTSSKSHG